MTKTTKAGKAKAGKAKTGKAKTGKAKTTDTRARVSVDGTQYRVTPEGLAKLNAPHWYHAPSRPGAPLPVKAPKASRHRNLSAWVARLSAEFVKKAKSQEARGAEFIGRAVGDGYYVVATDGHRALCQLGAAPKPDQDGVAVLNMAERAAGARWLESSDELLVALKRMRAANASKLPITTITTEAGSQRVTLSTRDPIDKTVAQEWLTVTGELGDGTVAINTKYLLSALGLPGQRIYLSDNDRGPVLIDTSDQRYRLVVMPCGSADITKPFESGRVSARQTIAAPVPEVPAVSVTAAPQTDEAKLTAGQKAWRTRQARIAAGAQPTDWVSAGRKAWETRMRNRQVAA